MSTARLALFSLALCACKTTGGDDSVAMAEPTQTPASDATVPEAGADDAAVDPTSDAPAAGDDAADPASGNATEPADDAGAADGGAPGPPDPPESPADGDDDDDAAGGGAVASADDLELPKPKYTEIDNSCGKDPGVGERLKSFKLPSSVEGKTISHNTYRGRVVLVNFWATWCKPCLKELPEFAALYRKYRKHGLTLLAISTEEDVGPINDYIEKKKVAAKYAYDAEDYAQQYKSPAFPFSFVVDHKGVIRASYRNYKPECMGKLEKDIREALERRATARKKNKK